MTASPDLDLVRQEIARAQAAGEPRPGRPTLAARLGISTHRVRMALAMLAPSAEDAGATTTPVPGSNPPAESALAPADATPRQDAPPVVASPVEATADAPAVTEPEPTSGASPVTLAPVAASEPPIRRAWLLLLALPAFVAVWGGWVGLGGLAGFGPVNLLPGMGGGWTVNLAITLPAGMEVYAVIGLRVWLSARTGSDRTRRFAAWSSWAALAVGCSGQVAYHVLARPATGAPMFVTVCVACLPVALLGMGAALFHLIGEDQRTKE